MNEMKQAAKAALSFSKILEEAELRIISLGAGVQSSVLALMAAKGEITPRPDIMIMSDTGWEPAEVYTHLKWLEGEIKRLTNGQMELHIVSAGNIRADHLAGMNSTGQRFAGMPLFTHNGGMGRRQCTREYKIEPVLKKTRDLLGLKPRQRAPKHAVVEQWIGISTDEIQRLKTNEKKFIENRWPLIEKGMSRRDCLGWFAKHYPGRKLAKSACIGCPFHTNDEWRRIRDTMPVEWADAIAFDKAIRHNGSKMRGRKEHQYLHRQCVPLDEADL